MPIKVQTPEGAIIEFPEDMSHDDIVAAMQKISPARSTKDPYAGIASEAPPSTQGGYSSANAPNGRVDLLLEAERRGILPPDLQDALSEARNRGMVPAALDGAQTTQGAKGNVFDQFDEAKPQPRGNVFDQFDAPARSGKAAHSGASSDLSFDDLIPQKQSKDISFDDLIPGKDGAQGRGNEGRQKFPPPPPGFIPAPPAGFVPVSSLGGQERQADSASTAAPQERQTYLDAREPSFSERLADVTGMSPQYTADVVHNLKAPARFMQGAEDPFEGIAQKLPLAGAYAASLGGYAPNAISRDLGGVSDTMTNAMVRKEEENQMERQAAGVEPGATDYSRMAGNAASPMNFLTAEAAGPVANFLQRRIGNNIVSRGLSAAGTGGAIAAEQPVFSGDVGSETLKQAEGGALTGGLLEAGASSLAPWINARAQRLAAAGVPTTLGQNIGPWASRVEEITQSVPLSGMAVRAARGRANEGLNRVVANEVLDPIGQRVNPDTAAGRDMVTEVNRHIENAYGRVIPNLRGEVDAGLQSDIAQIRAGLPARVQPDFDDAVRRNLLSKADQQGRLVGEDVKFADRDLRNESTRRVQTPANTDDYLLGVGLRDVRDSMRNMWDRHNSTQDVAAIRAADQAYAMKKIMERASSSVAAPDGVFNAAHLLNAVKAQDKTVGKRAFAEGGARLQQLADDAKAVMGNTVADSGTPERAALMALAHAGTTGAAVTGVVPPQVIVGLGLHAGAYTPWGQNALRFLAAAGAPGRNALAQGIRTASPAMINALAPDYTQQTPPTPRHANRR